MPFHDLFFGFLCVISAPPRLCGGFEVKCDGPGKANSTLFICKTPHAFAPGSIIAPIFGALHTMHRISLDTG